MTWRVVAIPVLQSVPDGSGRDERVDTPRIDQGFSRIGVDVGSVPHVFCLRTVSRSPARRHGRRFGNHTRQCREQGSRLRTSAPTDVPAPPAVTDSASTSLQTTSTSVQATSAPQTNDDRYRDGIIIWETPADAQVPFLLRFNINTQLRYLNTLSSDETYTDHLGVVREVHRRNDITVNRAMFIFGGYIFDQRARYSFTVWTSAGAASIIVASNIGWQFNRELTVTGGYTGVPGSRSLVNTFPYFQAIDRTMSDNFFRPGFTQGAWANGEVAAEPALSGVRRQRSQYVEYLGNQDRYESASFRQYVVGTAGSLRSTGQISQHVR